MKRFRSILQVAALIALLVTNSFASLPDAFSYSIGSNLNGQGGWVKGGTGDILIQTATSCGSGTMASSLGSTGNTAYTDVVTIPSVVVIDFFMSLSVANPTDYVGFFMTAGGGGAMSVEFESTGNIITFDSSGITTLQTFTANTCYHVTVELDGINHAGQFRITIDGGTGGTPTGWLGFIATPDGLGFENLSTNANAVFDSIGNGSFASGLIIDSSPVID